MAVCSKCGEEIPEGNELCEDCMLNENGLDDSLLEELMQNMGAENEEEPAASQEESSDAGEDIDALLDMLSGDFGEEDSDFAVDGDDLQEDSADTFSEEVAGEALPALGEASLFSDEDADSPDDIFADGGDPVAVDDIFQDALSAVAFSGKEEQEEAGGDMMALDPFDASAIEEEPEMADVRQSVKKPKKEKKPKEERFWNRVFGNVVNDEIAAEEARQKELEEAQAETKAQEKEERKKEAEAAKEAKAERAKVQKEQKAAERAEKAKIKAERKEEKRRLRLEQETNEVVGHINPAGAAVVMIFFGVFCIAVVLGAYLFSYNSSVRGAESSFEEEDYRSAYEAVAGVEVSESKEELKDKVRICMQLQQELDSYENYYKMKMYLEALDSLIKGVRHYDENKAAADKYEILHQYDALEDKIVAALYDEFGVTQAQAGEIIELEDQVQYTEKLQEIIDRWEAKMKQDER